LLICQPTRAARKSRRCVPHLMLKQRLQGTLVRPAEPLWDAMERAGGLVDSWGGGEFCHIFPRVLAFIQSGAVGS
jgi:hypothetical protein